jgi:hypothetical protein
MFISLFCLSLFKSCLTLMGTNQSEWFFGIKIIKILCKQKHMVNMAGNSRQTSSTKMSKCNCTNELVNDLIDIKVRQRF